MNPLVDSDWLANRLKAPNLVVVDASLPPVGITPAPDMRAAYAACHIPGAVFFDIDELSDLTSGLPHTLPKAAEFGRAMSEMGIGNEMTIVVYEQAPVYSAPRAWWMLRVFGARDVRILDGGLPAWRAAGLPVSSETVKRTPATFKAELDFSAVRSFIEVEHILATQGQIVDARAAGRFSGTAPEPRPGLSSGHMPGSFNVPYTEVFEEGRMKDPATLRALFVDRGIDLARPVTTSCGSGVTAAVLKVALERAGAQQVTLYDGSWAEYAQQPGAVIEKDEVR